jgi:hypothetical protein
MIPLVTASEEGEAQAESGLFLINRHVALRVCNREAMGKIK